MKRNPYEPSYAPPSIEGEPTTARKAMSSGTPATVGFIVTLALIFLVAVRNGFKGFIPSMS